MSESIHPVRRFRQAQMPPMTLGTLAAKVGITKASLSRIETGKLELSLAVARRLSAVTGIPLCDLRPDLAEEFRCQETNE